jgi:perosamine synthetase
VSNHYDVALARPDLSSSEIEYVVDAMRSSWISSTGKYVTRFEEEFAAACGTAHALTVCNGTVALHLALLLRDLRPGDEVIVPSLTYIATANAVRYLGAEPVFVDIDPETWCLDPSKIESAITRRTRGIIAVHLYGHPADMDEINHIAAVHGLWVVEDAAEAPFATYKGRPTGSLASIATFSFYGNKVLTSGEGGAVTVSDSAVAARARILRGQGMDPKRRYFFPVIGYNFRLTNVACAILCAQLERCEMFMQRRRRLYEMYAEHLANVPGITMQPVAEWARISPWLFPITIDSAKFGRSRDEIVSALDDRGVETRPFFIPLHTLPPYREPHHRGNQRFDVTEDIAARGLNLPTHTGLSDGDVAFVCEKLISLAVR